MATTGTGFAAGLRAGGGLVSQALENQRLDDAADRANTEFGWKKTDRDKAEADDKVQRDYRAKILAAASGIDPATSAQVQNTYGMTPAQQAAEGKGLPTKLASYDAPDASELPGGSPNAAGSAYGQALTAGLPTDGTAPAQFPALGGGAPAPAGPAAPGAAPAPPGLSTPAPFTASQVKTGDLNPLAVHDLIGQAALAKGDYKGYEEAKAAGRTADVQQITDNSVKEFMAMSPEDRAKRAWSPNLTGSTPLLTTKVDKNGMTVLVVNPDGSTDGKPLKLSWADAAQLHAAETMAGKGYGAEAIATATQVNARIGEAVKAQNDVMQKVATTNTDAAYKGGQLGVERDKLGIMRAELSLKRDKANAENNQIIGVTPNGITYFDQKSGKTSRQAWPDGTADEDKAMLIKKYHSGYEPKYSTDGQSMTIGPKTYDRNPDFHKTGKPNADKMWIDTTPGGTDPLDAFVKAKTGGGAAAAPGAPAAPAAPAAGAPPAAPPAPGLQLNTPPPAPAPYTPPPGSPAAKAAANRAAVAEKQDNFRTGTANAASIEADRVLAAGDVDAAYNLMNFNGFSRMPVAKQAAIQKLVMGR
jgi:hypothetical protein